MKPSVTRWTVHLEAVQCGCGAVVLCWTPGGDYPGACPRCGSDEPASVLEVCALVPLDRHGELADDWTLRHGYTRPTWGLEGECSPDLAVEVSRGRDRALEDFVTVAAQEARSDYFRDRRRTA